MATELIAVGYSAATSADIVLADGEAVTVALKAPGNRAIVKIELKDAAGEYNDIGVLDWQRPAASINAAGTYRLSRVDGTAAGDAGSCGVFRG